MSENKQLYEKQSNQYNPFFPIVRLEDIIETISDKSIQWILNNYNHIYVEYSESVAITRNKVPSLLRRNGLWISYNTGKGIVTEWYKGKNVNINDYNQWTDDANWAKFEPLADGKLTYQHLSHALKQLMGKGNTITNFPDEEDITTDGTVLSFKDREYDTNNFSGLGRVILRKNIVLDDGVYKNILTQNMINKSNTIYEIRYDFDLNGEEVTIPEGCVLDFSGGSFNNGSINNISYSNIVGNYNFIKSDCFIHSNEINADWIFADIKNCNVDVLKKYTNYGKIIHFSAKTYIFNSPVIISDINNGVARFYGVKDKTILKFPSTDGIVFKNSNWWNKYHTIRDLNIESYKDCLVLRPNTPGDTNSYCVKDSLFKNLKLTSETGFCIYNCLIKQDGGTLTLPHNNIFRNIRFHKIEGNINALVYGVIGLNNIFDDVVDDYTNSNNVILRTMFQNCIARFTNINVSYRGSYRQFIYNAVMSETETTRTEDNIAFNYGESNPIEIDNCNLESLVTPIIIEDTLRISLNDVQIPNWIDAQDVYYMFETKKIKYFKMSNVEFTGTNPHFTAYLIKLNGTYDSYKTAFKNTICESDGVTVHYNNSVYFLPKIETFRAHHTEVNYNIVKGNGFYKYLAADIPNEYKRNIGNYEHITCKSRSTPKFNIINEDSLNNVFGTLYLKIDGNTKISSIDHYDPFANVAMTNEVGIDNNVLTVEVHSAGKVTLEDNPNVQGGFILPSASVLLSYGIYVFHKVYANNTGQYNWKMMQGYHIAGSDAPIVRDVLNNTPPYINPTYKNSFIGIMKFSTVLNKPIWYNGSNWVDATGATV